jgi:hypothetical protein
MFMRKNVFCLTSLSAIAVLCSSLSATAQTIQPSATVMPENQVSAEIQPQTEFSPEVIPTTETGENLTPDNQPREAATATIPTETQQFPNLTAEKTPNQPTTPVPGTVATSSISLTSEEPKANFPEPTAQVAQPNRIAQSDINVGRSTRGGSSYIGVGANIGLSGGTSSLGDGNFAVISKIGFTRAFSVRPSVILGDNTTFLVPITYDFSFQQVGDPFTERLPIAPFVGVGAAIKTGDNSETAVLVTGGVDVPLNNRLTATASVNAGFFDQTDIGLILGVGYNFSGF